MEWRDVVDYEGLFKISEKGVIVGIKRKVRFGNTYRVLPEREIGHFLGKNGYYAVDLCFDGVCKRHYIHRLLAQHFIANPYNKKFINHKNGIKNCNSLENLEWVTPKENSIHAVNTGLTPVGSQCPWAKLNEETALIILQEYKKNCVGYKKLAKKYGVKPSTIQSLVNRKSWKHLKD